MPYVPSSSEVCPFWVNKTDNLETECFVPGDILPYIIIENPEAVNSFFGWAVAISENYIVIGSYKYDRIDTTNAGQAYIFNASSGELLHTLQDPDPINTSDHFGISVDVCESYTLIGSQYHSISHNSGGALFLYNNSDGTLKYTFTDPDTGNFELGFENCIAITEDYSIVGQGYDDTGTTNAGVIYIFSNSTGNLIHTINNPAPVIYDYFGYMLSANNNYIVANSGDKSYVFNISDWTLRWTLTSPNADPIDNGDSPAISDNYIVIGQPGYDLPTKDVGVVHVYSNLTGNYLYTINSPINDTYVYFGWRIDCSETHIIIATSEDPSHVFIYDITNGNLIEELINPDLTNGFGFGSDVAIYGSKCVIGDNLYEDENTGNLIGRAYKFDV